MFISKEWEDIRWSKETMDKKFYNLVLLSNEFWDKVTTMCSKAVYGLKIFHTC
jgi:hypothetical protein